MRGFGVAVSILVLGACHTGGVPADFMGDFEEPRVPPAAMRATGGRGAEGEKREAGESAPKPWRAPEPVIGGLVARYRGHGVDLSGHERDATIVGAVELVPDRFGIPRSAAWFDGAEGNFMIVSDHDLLPTGSAPRTVSAWFRTSASHPVAGGVVNWGENDLGKRFGLLVLEDTDYFVGQWADLPGSRFVSDDRWHDMVTVFDGTTVSVYVDTVLSASGEIALDTTRKELVIGRSPLDHHPEPFTGAIDDVRIYDRVLSADERAAIFAHGGWR
ncbi:MAG: LamG domain-containing protein [Labilithrix sp.]|nr:LamG domain-containing protein [Labilithrix sp.]